ncbi:MAG TPA: class I tRNA ligase family protein, partial [Candidatus Saccharimonadales bacterium]|nr:class I tRNA ligase family protein [Candidatus Saccharimonadales bacterium]
NQFAVKFGLPVVEVIERPDDYEGIYTGEGTLKNSDKYGGLGSGEARERITRALGKDRVNYKIRDWLISRQRYWGAPIPIIHCPKCGLVPVPDKDLPVVLPEVKSYEPSGDGRSPLANVPEFVNVDCPKCGGKAERETDTMDGFACSSWYFLRFADPHNDKQPFAKDKAEYWLPVDDYIGGAEHAVMHLLYARFWTKVMFDEGLINFDEPFSSLRNHGMILAPDGSKMSKSKNNTIEPDELLEQGYGADSIRLMELFIGSWDQAVNWSVEGIGGTYRFLQRYWTLAGEFLDAPSSPNQKDLEVTALAHKTVKKVSRDLTRMDFNTAIAAMMEFVNQLYKLKTEEPISQSEGWRFALETLTQLLAPFAPHITEELWNDLGHTESVHIANWPEWDEKLVAEEVITLAVQVNGKVRAEIIVATDITEAEVIAAAKIDDRVAAYLKGKPVKKAIYVPGRLVSLVI